MRGRLRGGGREGAQWHERALGRCSARGQPTRRLGGLSEYSTSLVMVADVLCRSAQVFSQLLKVPAPVNSAHWKPSYSAGDWGDL